MKQRSYIKMVKYVSIPNMSAIQKVSYRLLLPLLINELRIMILDNLDLFSWKTIYLRILLVQVLVEELFWEGKL